MPKKDAPNAYSKKGTVPLLISSGAGSEKRAAISVVILFGVIAAAKVCVLFVPTAYAVIERGSG